MQEQLELICTRVLLCLFSLAVCGQKQAANDRSNALLLSTPFLLWIQRQETTTKLKLQDVHTFLVNFTLLTNTEIQFRVGGMESPALVRALTTRTMVCKLQLLIKYNSQGHSLNKGVCVGGELEELTEQGGSLVFNNFQH